MKSYKAGKGGFTDKAHLKAKGLIVEVMVQSENQTSISRRRNENFKKTTYSRTNKVSTIGNVGTLQVNSVEDGSIGVHNIHDSKVLERVNAFVGSIAGQEYLNLKKAVEQLASKLKTLGLEMTILKCQATVQLILKFHNSEEDLVKILMVPILKMMAYLTKKRVVSNLMLSTKH